MSEGLRLYRPSNGTEGADFQARFCNRCKRDREWREHERNPCFIWTGALCFNTEDEHYPAELQYDESGAPTCTAFEFDPSSKPPGPLVAGPMSVAHPPSLLCGRDDSHLDERVRGVRAMNRNDEERGTMSAETKQAKHTPGPWRVGFADEDARTALETHGEIEVVRDDHSFIPRTVATVEVDGLVQISEGEPEPFSRALADARLIAAAPAMYEALEEVHDFIRFGIELGYIRMPDADLTDAAHDVPEKVRAALAQARGEG